MSCNCNSLNGLPNGNDGYNAYTVTTASYVQPAVNTNVTISVSNNDQFTGKWAIAGQTIFVESGGYYIVVSSTSTSITMKYEADYATYNQSLTAAAATVATNKKVSPAGKKGQDGTNGVDGSGVLYSYVSTTGTGNDASTGESSLGSYTVTANELGTNGDELDIDVYYTYSQSDRVVMRYKFGGSTVYSYEEVLSMASNNSVNIKISRISASTQLLTITKLTANNGRTYSSILIDSANLSATLSNSNLFEITADNQVSGANQVVLKKLVIKKYSA